MFKKSHFREWFNKQYGKRAQALLKFASQRLYHIHWSLTTKFCSKKSFLSTCQILGLLVNTLPTDEKYLFLNRDNLTTQIQMQLSLKQRKLTGSFFAFLKSKLNFEYFEKKYDPYSFCISEITDSDNGVR